MRPAGRSTAGTHGRVVPAPGAADAGVRSHCAVATTWPAGAQAVSSASSARTVSQVSAPATPEGSSRPPGSTTPTVSPAAIGRASTRTGASGTPSTARTPTKRSPSVVAECRRLRTCSVEPSRSRRTGAFTAAHSARPGVGVPSGSTIPSMTKLPSCTTSPKSPP